MDSCQHMAVPDRGQWLFSAEVKQFLMHKFVVVSCGEFGAWGLKHVFSKNIQCLYFISNSLPWSVKPGPLFISIYLKIFSSFPLVSKQDFWNLHYFLIYLCVHMNIFAFRIYFQTRGYRMGQRAECILAAVVFKFCSHSFLMWHLQQVAYFFWNNWLLFLLRDIP